MREFRVTVKDEVQNNSLLCRVVPSVIDIGGIAGEHNATRITFVLPESWNTDEGSFFVECESNNGEAALSVELSVATENGAKVIYFDIPYGMTAAGTSELTLKQETFDEDGKTLIKCVRSAKLRVRFPDSTSVDGENRKLAEDLLGGMSAEISGLVTRFNNGEFNGKDGKDGADGAKGEKGDKGDKGEDGTGGIPIVTELPENAVNGDLCLYSVPNILKSLDDEGRLVISIEEIQALSTTGENADFAMILRKNGVEVINLFVYSYDNQTSNFQYINVAEGTDYFLSFDNGVYDPSTSYINGEVVDLSAFPETYPLPEYDSIACDVSGGLPERYRYVAQLMEYDNGWQAVKSLLEISNKAHTHNNKKTLDFFYCESLETGFETDVSSTELKWQGKPIAFDFAGSKVSMVQEVEKNGKRYYRLWFTHGSFTITNVPDYIDLPIDTLNNVTEESGNITLNGAELDFGLGTVGPDGTDIPLVSELPTNAKYGDMCIYARANDLTIDDAGKTIYFSYDWLNQLHSFDENEAYNFSMHNTKEGTAVNVGLYAAGADNVIILTISDNYRTYSLNYRPNAEGVYSLISYAEDPDFASYYSDEDGTVYITEAPKSFTIPKETYDVAEISEPKPDYVLFYHKPKLMIYSDQWSEVGGEIRGGIDKVETNATETTMLQPNVFYDFGISDTLTLDFTEGEADKVNEYLFSFISGETATVLTLPSTVKWVNELTVEANKRYEISVVDNVALWCAVDYEVTE